jgi:hypothetical protein
MNKTEQPAVEISKEVAASWKILKENKINLVPAPKSIKVTGSFDFKPEEWIIERKEKSDFPGYDHFVKRLDFCNIKSKFKSK